MRGVAAMSLRAKLVTMTILIVALALVTAFAVLTFLEWSRSRARLAQTVTAVTHGVVRHLERDIGDLEPKHAADILATMQYLPGFTYAALYDAVGKRFAAQSASGGGGGSGGGEIPEQLPSPEPDGVTVSPLAARARLPVMIVGQRAGTLVVVLSTAPLHAAIRDDAAWMAVIMATALLVVAIPAYRAQRRLTAPILRLADAVRQVTETGNYRMRVVRSAGHELAVLSEGINAMLQQLEDRARDVYEAAANLEGSRASLKETEARLVREQTALARLAGLSMTPGKFLCGFADEVGKTLEVSAVSIWRFDGERTSLRCLHNHGLGPHHESELQVPVEALPDYVAGIKRGRRLVVADAHGEPASRGLASYYAEAFGIRLGAALHVPLRISGQVAGVLALDMLQTPRTWFADEENLAVAVAEMLSLNFEEDQRRKAERALRESENRFRSLSDASPIGIFLTDTTGDVIYLNARLRELSGIAPRTSIGNRWHAAIHPDDVAAHIGAWDEAMRSAAEYFCEYRLTGPAGRVRQVRSRASRLTDDRGKMIGYVGTVEDITDLREQEARITRLNEELEHRVEERTRDLAAALKELESFSYSVSHDLRAPLRHVDGFSQALLEDYDAALDDTGRDFLRRIRASAERMGQLIDDILRLSRVTSAEMNRSELDLSQLAREIAQSLSESAPSRVVSWEIAPDIAGNGDASLVRVLLSNLFENAFKYTSKKPEAEISFSSSRDSNGIRTYCVRDNGAGFDMAYAHKLFHAFQRLHADSEFAGTGIGLATVQRVVRRHGGHVWADGKVGQHARFYFTLGADRDTDRMLSAPQHAEPAPSEGRGLAFTGST
ncbi:MAG: PAS domain-containing protein [Candidatus Schekmanbacteria bacterium]|nr:PAS domain-containing protein [Candidatus Schekmanbacteria bacterium]